ncbi:hypothetical protein PV326_008054, partial [Microctonus aethiopoides]
SLEYVACCEVYLAALVARRRNSRHLSRSAAISGVRQYAGLWLPRLFRRGMEASHEVMIAFIVNSANCTVSLLVLGVGWCLRQPLVVPARCQVCTRCNPEPGLLKVEVFPRFMTVKSSLAAKSATSFPLVSEKSAPHSADLALKSPAIMTSPSNSLTVLSIAASFWRKMPFPSLAAQEAFWLLRAFCGFVAMSATFIAALAPVWSFARGNRVSTTKTSIAAGYSHEGTNAVVHPTDSYACFFECLDCTSFVDLAEDCALTSWCCLRKTDASDLQIGGEVLLAPTGTACGRRELPRTLR